MSTKVLPRVSADGSDLAPLRREVRAFIAEQRAAKTFTPVVDSWGNGWSPAFSRELARRGWVGMTIPATYGGAGGTFLERFAVTGELLAAGAPVSAHWVADRQIAPSLLRHGSPEQCARFLPPIARAEEFWAIGMSEPGSGSDLASVRTRAERVDGGWEISGTKLWTSGAHAAHFFIVLARTAPLDGQHRHRGLSQFIVPLQAPGITISPILNMSGEHHFNEVVLERAFVAEDMLLGTDGDGWKQVTSELGFERSGPERVLSTFVLLSRAVEECGSGSVPTDPRLGALIARIAALHGMSHSVAHTLARGENAEVAAALVKLLGTQTEGDVVDVVGELTSEIDPAVSQALRDHLREGVMARPGFTIRGGTSQVLSGVVARGLGMR